MGRLSASTLLLGACVLAACGGGDATSPDDDHQNNQTLGINLDKGEVSVAKGSSGTVAITLTRGGGYAGSVSFQVEGAPGDATVGISPQTVTGAATTATMTITANATAAVARHLMTVHASGNGVNQCSAPLWLNVVEPPDYSLKTSVDTLRVIQGSSGSLDVALTRVSGFAGGVTLALEGVPAGAAGTFAPNPATATSSTLSVTVGAAVAAGKYTLTVHGTATGLSDRTTTFVLDVVATSTPGFTISVDSASLTLAPGGPGVSTRVHIRRSGGFAGLVTFAVQAYPTGVTWTGTHEPLPPAMDTAATLTFSAGLATQAGTYAVTIRGSSGGQPDSQVPLQLTVQTVTGFLFQLSSNAVTTSPGGSPQVVNATITRSGGFADTVHLSVTGLPTTITATFNPAATVGNGATLTIAASSAATAGTYTGTVHAAATGLAERTTTLTVTVQAASTDVVWRFCAPNPSPVFFALQDGSSPFALVQPAGDGSYVTSLSSTRGAVVFVVPGLPDTAGTSSSRGGGIVPLRRPGITSVTDAGYTTYMYYGTTDDLRRLAQSMCPATGSPRTVGGSVAGVPGDAAWTVALDGASYIGMPGAATGFTLRDVLAGPHDLVAGRAPFSENQTLANAFVIRRDLDPANGSTLPVIDFNGGEAFGPAAGTLTVTGLVGTPTAEAILGFVTANGTASMIGQLGMLTSTARPIAGVPANRLRAGDLHTAAVAVEAGPSFELGATLYATQVGAWTVAIATTPPSPLVDVYATSPIVRMRARGSTGGPGAPYAGTVVASFVQAGAQRATVVSLTQGWMGTTQNFEIRTGGFSSLAGWNEGLYGFQIGTPVAWAVALTNAGYVVAPADGTVLRTMRVMGQVTP